MKLLHPMWTICSSAYEKKSPTTQRAVDHCRESANGNVTLCAFREQKSKMTLNFCPEEDGTYVTGKYKSMKRTKNYFTPHTKPLYEMTIKYCEGKIIV